MDKKIRGTAEQNKEALRQIMARLKAGDAYGFVFNYRPDHPDRPRIKEGFWNCLFKHPYKNLICWNNFGSSAEKCTMKDLNWIIRKMFGITPYIFLHNYTTDKLAFKFIFRAMDRKEWRSMAKPALHLNWKY